MSFARLLLTAALIALFGACSAESRQRWSNPQGPEPWHPSGNPEVGFVESRPPPDLQPDAGPASVAGAGRDASPDADLRQGEEPPLPDPETNPYDSE